VAFGGHDVGKTGERGSLALAIHGTEGEHVALTVACPEGYQSRGNPIDVVLHRLSEPGRKPEYDVACRPVTRSLVIVVRADQGPRLPVLYLGKEVARTDESGAAHALVKAPASEDVEVTISTSDAANQRLRPQSPSMKFVAADQGDIKLFSVKFTQEPEKRRAASRPLLPVRLN
jgi:hypothetical protein